MRTIVQSIISLFITATASFGYGIASGIFKLQHSSFYKPAAGWAKAILSVCNVNIIIQGEIDRKQSVIYIANHKSLADTLVMVAVLPIHTNIMYKAELLSAPGLGFALKHSPYIPVERANAQKAALSYSKAKKQIQEGDSIFIFPEGTWTDHPDPLPFKQGAFKLAKETNVPIIPIAMKGTDKIIEQDKVWINSGSVELIICDPILPDEFSTMSEADIAKKARQIIMEKLQS